MIRLRSRLEELERDNSDLSSTLVKKEQDLEAKAQEKEDLQGRKRLPNVLFIQCRVVQLNLTLEIELFSMLFEISLSIYTV